MTPEPIVRRDWAWLIVWPVLAVFIVPYVRTQYRERREWIKHPIRAARDMLQQTLDFGASDPAKGRFVLEGENAPEAASPTPTWQTVRTGEYSRGAAAFTNQPGRVLRIAANIPAGDYRLFLFAYAYKRGTENAARVQVGAEQFELTWPNKRPPGRTLIERDVHLAAPASRITLTALHIGQENMVIDSLVLLDRQRAGGGGWGRIARYAGVLAAVVGLLACGLGWGAVLLRIIGAGLPDALTHLLISMALGLGAIATMTTIVGTIGWFTRPVVLPMLALGLIAGAKPVAAAVRQFFRETVLFRSLWFTVPVLSFVAVLSFATIAAFAPAVGVDPLINHLSIAKWLLIEGRFNYHPYQLAWAFPHLTSNLYAVVQMLDNDDGFRSAVLLHAATGWLWLAVVYCAGRHLFGRAAGLAAAVLCASIEGVLYEFGLGLADLNFAFFSTATLMAFIAYLSEWPHPRGNRQLLIAGLIAGAAAVCKVNGPTIAITLGVCAGAWALSREGWKAALRSLAFVGLVSLAVASPMYLKNYLVWGNPIYPFGAVFPNRDLTQDFGSMFGNGDWPSYLARTGPLGWVRWPYDWMRKQAPDWCSPGPAFIAGALLIVASWRRWTGRHWPLYLWAFCLMAFWFLISPLARFGWPWLGVLTIFAAAPLSERPWKWPRAAPALLLVCIAIPTLLGELWRSVNTLNVVTGRSDELAYLQRMENYHAGAEYGPPMEGIFRLNDRYLENPSTERVLLDTNMVAYADYPNVPSTYYLIVQAAQREAWTRADGYPCLAFAGQRVDDELMRRELIDRLNVRHILFKKSAAAPRPGSDGRYHFSELPQDAFGSNELFTSFIERWVRDGRAQRVEYSDSVLYTLSEN